MGFDITYQDIDHRMGFHPADTDLKRKAHETARMLTIAWAKAMIDILPAGREKSLFATAAGDALMYANQALALNGGPKEAVDLTELEDIIDSFAADYGQSPPAPSLLSEARD